LCRLKRRTWIGSRSSAAPGLVDWRWGLLSEYLRYEVCQQAERLCAATTLTEAKVALNFLELVRERAPEVLNDDRVRRRIGRALAANAGRVNPPDARFLSDLARMDRGASPD